MNSDIPIRLALSNLEDNEDGGSEKNTGKNKNPEVKTRFRSNSQSHVIATPNLEPSAREEPQRRKQYQYFVTLTSLNDTFTQKHFSVPYNPDTRKLGRPTGSKIKPDVSNGFFDSRVLSRNHAVMYMDSETGKLMLKDLGSSNGTFVNSDKLDAEPVEIKVGDTICFGFSIQAGLSHKQILSKVDSIDIMSNFIKTDDLFSPQMDSTEFQQYQFIENLYNQITKQSVNKEVKEDVKPITFDSAMFSDINPDVEDSILGLHTKVNNGIFKNSGTSVSLKVEEAVNLLINCFTNVKQQNSSLKALSSFMQNYRLRLNELNEEFLRNEYNTKLTGFIDKIEEEKMQKDKVNNEFSAFREQNFNKIKKLEEKIFQLKNEKQELNRKLNQLNTMLQEKEFKIKELENQPSNNESKTSVDTIAQGNDEELIIVGEINKTRNGKISLDELKDSTKVENLVPSVLNDMESVSKEDFIVAEASTTSKISTTQISNTKESINMIEEPQKDIPTNGDLESSEKEGESTKYKEFRNELTENSQITPQQVAEPDNSNDYDKQKELDLDQIDEDNDLRYNSNGLAIGLTALIIGIILHKYAA